ncbi:MAG: hypothetical protein JO345_20330 [Streptosporangiaceae bacterium]|nr:hypothetical protein [Streptosporangiaceae bacterium]
MTTVEGATTSVSGENSGTIPVSCVPHRGARDFATLVVNKRGKEIVRDVQVSDG